MTQKQMLVTILTMILKSQVCPKTPRSKWPKILLDAHSRGYLYVHMDNGILDSVVMAYRTPNIWDTKQMPSQESGRSLYVAWAVSTSNSKFTLMKMLRQYLKNNTDIDRVYYHRRNNPNDLREWHIKQGVLNNV